MTIVAQFGEPRHAGPSLFQREVFVIGKYRAFALAIVALVFVVFFWYFGDPLTGILAALIALVAQLIGFAFVMDQAAEGKKKDKA